MFPDSEVNFDAVKSWFMHSGQLGEVAAGQNAQMFVLLKSGLSDQILEVSTPLKKNSSKKNYSKNGETKKNPIKSTDEKKAIDSEERGLPHKPELPTVHIDLQIHLSPEASSEQIDKVFESIARHLYGNS